MNAALTTICNVIPSQSGVVPPAPSSTPKNAQNSTDKTAAPENRPDNSGTEARNTRSSKDNQSFDDTLREKLNSQPPKKEAPDDKNKKDQDLEPTNPEATAPVVPNTDYLFNAQPVATDDVGLLDLSGSAIPTEAEGLNELQAVAASALETVTDNKTAVAGNPLTTSAPAEGTATTSILPDQNPPQTVQTAPVDTRTSADIEQPAANTDASETLPPPEPLAAETAAPQTSLASKNPETQTPARNFTDLVEKSSPSQPLQDTVPVQEELPKGEVESLISPQKGTIPAQNTAARFYARQENLSPEQLSSVQAETRKNLLSAKEGFNAKLESAEQLSGGTTGSTAVTESTTPAKTAVEATSGLGVGRQIQESISNTYRPGTQQIVIRLDPPGLGKVTIKFVERPDGITGVLQVDKPETQHEIQQALPGLIQTLQNADIQIKKLEVVSANPQEFNASGEQSAGQNSGFGQQNSSSPYSLGNTPSYNEWLNSQDPLSDAAHPQAQLTTDQSINMLI